ncbi:RAD9, HUS1, RAD1-interacting nuclear orphan protein 1 [Choloepus didactylus]|uniref:RAD9, HUS1, RAD1-interacting nuclear orphan protein 1-like n=1 Tax=Choloepus didactylus TaxID=27675 RepID=UPI00189FC180|nr:RAD9, HUS1, RAD1-interacting nuclear orphan protein 1-like [Choloepus didactylus]XP_037702165.1 RAD9, HUS1, RAD1-interacting nuclear orphan protein 1 [Choloepus didactylus]XP_037702166.1 RAD9, HUS1, RAD1-interacting nuclear orphan protein 1 [Choloepus didactylus]XP_037702167.1 RAD9, HUS1, RAD1-interacting nuclear orphan protein 1 [Choloepus didactylus]
MPPRKKRHQRSQKAPLLFQQQPLEGPKHRSGSPQRPITRTRRVPSKPIDHNTITSWVLPQFDVTAESWYPVNQKRHHRDHARPIRKSATAKFPHLTFETPQSSSSVTLGIPLIKECPKQLEKDISVRPLVPMLSPQSSGELSMHTLQSPAYIFIPPDIQTAESSMKEESIHSDQRKNTLPSCSVYTSTPKSAGPGPALVKDTPEEKYGIKVTWRRRKHLFAYLKERGKLNKSQFLVKN